MGSDEPSPRAPPLSADKDHGDGRGAWGVMMLAAGVAQLALPPPPRPAAAAKGPGNAKHGLVILWIVYEPSRTYLFLVLLAGARCKSYRLYLVSRVSRLDSRFAPRQALEQRATSFDGPWPWPSGPCAGPPPRPRALHSTGLPPSMVPLPTA